MLMIRWDTLFAGTIVAVMLAALVVQVVFRVNVGRLLDAFKLSQANTTDEPNLYEFLAERRPPSAPFTSHRRQAS